MERIDELKILIGNSRNIVAFTGAGISTNSGLPDFRSKSNGISKEIDIENVLSHRSLKQDPDKFYEFYKKYFLFKDAKPNDAHFVLARLEKMGKLKAVITQNVDGLHQMGGSQYVIELHGNQREYFCIDCKKEYCDDLMEQEGVLVCRCGGVIRPNIVLYGESLPDVAFDTAMSLVYESDLLIVAGTSLSVYPACDLLRYARRNIVIINKEPTKYDYMAELVFNEDVSDVLTKML